MTETTVVNREKLMNDLRTVISDAEEVLKVTADQATAGAAELRVRMQERLQQASTGCTTCRTMRSRARRRPCRRRLRARPSVEGDRRRRRRGLIIGLLIGRR